MLKSDMAKKLSKVIDAVDKLVLDIHKDTKKAAEALKELKESNKESNDKEKE